MDFFGLFHINRLIKKVFNLTFWHLIVPTLITAKIALQILFYFTFGGIGIWAIIRLFTLGGAIKDYNRRIASQVGLDTQEMATLNLL